MATALAKGSLYVRERGLLYKFMFNPESIDITNEVIFPKDSPAGASNSIYNFASRGERLISFTLYLDGDRGRSDLRQKPSGQNDNRANINTGRSDGPSMSIMDEVNLLQSLTFPTQYGRTITEVYPKVCLFTFGEAFQATPVIVKKADPKLSYFHADLSVVRGTVSMQLGEIRPSYQTAEEFLRTGLSPEQRRAQDDSIASKAAADANGGPSGYRSRYVPFL